MQNSNAVQGSEQWKMDRCGNITSSRVAEMMKYINKGKDESAERYDYKIELVTERLTGIPVKHRETPEMIWGTTQEPFARAHYEAVTGEMVDQVGFIVHPEMDFAGGSPDGLIGSEGVLEIKAPNTTNHVKWIRAGVVPEKHRDQCLFNMAVSGRDYADFMSYDPRLPAYKRFIVRMYRDDARIKEIEAEVRKFNQEIIDLINSLPAAA